MCADADTNWYKHATTLGADRKCLLGRVRNELLSVAGRLAIDGETQLKRSLESPGRFNSHGGHNMRLRRITIRKLFGMFDHDIQLNQRERITIIHGPNGVGKTTVRRLIADLFSRRYLSLQRVPFSSMRAELRNGSGRATLTVRRTVTKKKDKPIELKFRLEDGSERAEGAVPKEHVIRMVLASTSPATRSSVGRRVRPLP